MRNIHQRYVTETYDEQGILETFSVHCPEDYNFAYDAVDDIAIAEPDRPAMIWINPEGEEHVFSFGDMKYWSDKTANFLEACGIGYGDMVLVILRRHYQFWFVALALDKLGAVIVPATFMLKEHDLEYRVNSAGIETLICTDVGDIANVVDHAMPLCPSLTTRIIVNGAGGGVTSPAEIAALRAKDISDQSAFNPYTAKGSVLSGPQGVLATRDQRDGWIDFNAGVTKASADFARRDTLAVDPMIMYFSSGTSGNPKMVLHNSLYSLAHLGTGKHWHNLKGDKGLHFTIADTGWGKAVWGKLYGQWLMETSVMVYDFDRFIGDEICEIIDRYQVTSLCCPPTMYRLILQGNVDAFDLGSLEYSCTAGEALNPDLFDRWRRRTGLYLTEGFGQTETTVTVANLVGMTPKPGSMGKPIPLYATKILDENGDETEAGQTGEICIAYDHDDPPPGLMLEYYRDPVKTAEAIHNGWYHTGDTAWRDEDGYFWYVGRNDDVIKSSGYRISPFEIESVLLLHPAVNECAVTGVPDPLRGRAVKATIVLAPGFEPSDELTKDIQTFMKQETAPYKYPRIVDYISELPKTVNGKVRRAVIRAADEKGTTTAAAAERRAPEEFGG